MDKIISYIVIGTITLIGVFGFSKDSFASENHADFSVNAEQSVYQVDKGKTYFDVSLPVNENIPLVVHVTNNSTKTIEVVGEVSPATTNINGVVEYGKTKNQLTSAVPFDITKFASFEKEKQTIQPNQTVDFILNVSIPTKEYAGVVAGGLTFRDVTKETQQEDSEKSMFRNKFAYAIALLIHGEHPKTENKVSLKDVLVSQINHRNVVIAKIENMEANYINKVSVEARIVNNNGENILSEKKKDLQIAPNSIFAFPIYYEKQEMKSGEYTLQLLVKTENKVWKFDKTFTITKEKAKELNQTDVLEKERAKNSNWLVVLLIVIILILVFILLIQIKVKK